MTPLRLKINGQWLELSREEFSKVQNLLENWPLSTPLPGPFALALNGTFVPKRNYSQQGLADRDEVEVISPHPGG